jgi:hypothetical protein
MLSVMETLILETDTLQKAIASRIRTRRVKLIDFESGITLLPLDNKNGVAFSDDVQEEKMLEEERESRFHAPKLSDLEVADVKKQIAGTPFEDLFGVFASEG